MLGLGFAIGWVAKPAPEPKQAVAAESSFPKAPSAATAPEKAAEPRIQGKRSDRDITVMKSGMPETKEQKEMVEKMKSEMTKQLAERQRAKFGQQIERLAESLNLSASQKDALNGWLEGKISNLEKINMQDPSSMTAIGDGSAFPTMKSLEETLLPGLSEDQKAAFGEFKEKEHRGKVDTLALKSLSKLQGVIDFEEGQRDEVYKLLSEGAETTLKTEDEKPDVSKMFTEGMGIEMDPYDLGLQHVMTTVMADDKNLTEAAGQKEVAKKIRAAFDERIEAKVELLRPVLNEKQLGQYRTELKTKGLGVYGNMLSGME